MGWFSCDSIIGSTFTPFPSTYVGEVAAHAWTPVYDSASSALPKASGSSIAGGGGFTVLGDGPSSASSASGKSTATSGGQGQGSNTAAPSSKTNVGAIAGGVVGGIAILGATIFGIVFLCMRKRRARAAETDTAIAQNGAAANQYQQPPMAGQYQQPPVGGQYQQPPVGGQYMQQQDPRQSYYQPPQDPSKQGYMTSVSPMTDHRGSVVSSMSPGMSPPPNYQTPQNMGAVPMNGQSPSNYGGPSPTSYQTPSPPQHPAAVELGTNQVLTPYNQAIPTHDAQGRPVYEAQ
jgi:hypothetical protein